MCEQAFASRPYYKKRHYTSVRHVLRVRAFFVLVGIVEPLRTIEVLPHHHCPRHIQFLYSPIDVTGSGGYHLLLLPHRPSRPQQPFRIRSLQFNDSCFMYT